MERLYAGFWVCDNENRGQGGSVACQADLEDVLRRNVSNVGA